MCAKIVLVFLADQSNAKDASTAHHCHCNWSERGVCVMLIITIYTYLSKYVCLYANV